LNIFQSFEMLKVDKELSALFDNVEVVRLKINRDKRIVNIYVDSPKIFAFNDKLNLAEQLKNQVFFTMADTVNIVEHFSLPGNFELSRIFSLYKNSLYDEIQYNNHMDYHILINSRVEIDDVNNRIIIDTDKDFASEKRSQKLTEWLKDMFVRRFDIEAEVIINLIEAESPAGADTNIAPYEIYDLNTMKSYKVSPLDYDRGVISSDEYDNEEGKEFVTVTSGDGFMAEEFGLEAGEHDPDVASENAAQITGNQAVMNGDNFISSSSDNDSTVKGANGKTDANKNDKADRKTDKSNEKKGENGNKDSKKTGSKFEYKKSEKSKQGTKRKDFKRNEYKRYNNSVDEDIIYGRECEGDVVRICDIVGESGEVVIHGMIDSVDETELRTGNILLTINITDFTDTIAFKIFLKPSAYEADMGYYKKGKFLKVKGVAEVDKFDNELAILNVRGIKQAEAFSNKIKRVDNSKEKRVELHCHTQFSDMDGVSSPDSIISKALEWGHSAIAITDHGVVQGFPVANHAIHDLAKKNEKAKDFKIIYGVEGYLVDDEIPLIKNENGQTLDDTYVVFDIETTGLNPYNHYIIEIGAVKICGGNIVERFSEFINPLVSIPYEIEELTGIKDSMLKDAGLVEDILPQFLEFAKDSVLVAHNAEFDVNFIRIKAEELGIKTDFTVADTMTLARLLLKDLKTFNLKSVSKALMVPLENHHRAVVDAETTAGIFIKMTEMLREQGISNLKEINELGKKDVDLIRKTPSNHIILLAANDIGRVNLYTLISKSHIEYFNRQPKIPKSLITRYREGLIVGSACEAGDLFQAILRGQSEKDIERIVDFYDYLEIQPVGNNEFMLRDSKYGFRTIEDLRDLNRRVVYLGEAYNKPVVATCDVHFLDPEDEIYRRIIMAGKGFEDADMQAPLYLHTTEEMLEEFSYLGEEKAYEVVVTNTNLIADRIEKISPVRPDKCPPVIPNSDNDLRNICYEKAHSMYGDKLPEIVEARLERELNSIISNGYSVMYIIAQKLVWKSVEDGYLVGSRGSVGSSFAATMSGITEVNPLPAHYYCPKCHYSDFDSDMVKQYRDKSGYDMPDANCPECGELMIKDGHNIPFETFLGFKGNKEPDIDLNFSGEYQNNAHKYTEVLFGEGHTFRAGTIGTLAEKTAFGFVKNYYEERMISKRKAEIERIARGCTGVRRTTGQHPGGIVVLPHDEEIYSFTPIQKPANDMSVDTITTHFEYHSIDHNLLKLDILGHDDPTMIRMLQDLSGMEIDEIPLCDEKVMGIFSSTESLGIRPEDIGGCTLGSLGIPELGTKFSMDMLVDTSPSTFSELVRISGLSHGTDVWTNNAQDLIRNGDCTLSSAICTRDDIMTYLISMGVENSLSFKIMESVRKGKGLTPEMEEAMIAQNVPEWYIGSCKKIKYMFPKAHAVAYIMMAMRIAWFKVHEPLMYYCAFLSIRAKSFDYEKMAFGLDNLMKNLNATEAVEKKTAKDKELIKDMNIVREMYARGFRFEPIDIYKASVNRFQIVDGKLMPSLSTIDGLGDIAAEALVREAKNGEFYSIDDFKQRTGIGNKTIEKMKELGLFGDLPQSNQLSLFDFF